MTEQTFKHEVITPSDTAELNKYSAIVVIDGGNVAIEDRFGTVITYPNVPPYTTFENFMPGKILATGTTALNIVGWVYAGS